eukprot:CAMPEP_0175347570 /NCGR_PEP_ID=MMETSP0095-20121207/9444_1 /TAXON_ID=311494 /ORGANISM="Alexandrium monilatum, Strain CCMP3105" /LENGTH=118 /DNA_ID=CAMNT_0016645059 /DNA_START=128 /DNA_END=481 /DNA_ORIENTATION=+
MPRSRQFGFSRHLQQTDGPTRDGFSSHGSRGEPTTIFTKTKMCRFQILNMCSRGSDCKFAHHKCELKPLPDLSRTKLCKALIFDGECRDPSCRYAHTTEELRTIQLERRGGGRPCEPA